jgi:hypothetical protein
VSSVFEIDQGEERACRLIAAGMDLGEERCGFSMIIAAGAAPQSSAAGSIRGCDARENRESGSNAE